MNPRLLPNGDIEYPSSRELKLPGEEEGIIVEERLVAVRGTDEWWEWKAVLDRLAAAGFSQPPEG